MYESFFDKIHEISQIIQPLNSDYEISEFAFLGFIDEKEPRALLSQLIYFLKVYYNCEINSIDELKAYYSLWKYESLYNTLVHAKKKSYFYKNKLKRIDLKDEIDNLKSQLSTNKVYRKIELSMEIEKKIKELLKLLPCTSFESINNDYNAFLAIRHDDVKSIISVQTSGTKTAKRVYSSNNDLSSTVDFYYYGMQHILKNKNNKVAILFSSEREGTVGNLMISAMKRTGIECEIFSLSNDFNHLLKQLLEYLPTCLIGIPWHVHKLSFFIRETPLRSVIKSVLVSGDILSKNLKLRIEENLSCKVYEHYGLTEFGLGGAVESYEINQLVMRGFDTYIEVLDENENPVKNGEYGEIVITSLTREAMPFIRFKTGDIGKRIENYDNKNYIFDHLNVKSRVYESLKKISSSLNLYDMQNIFYSSKLVYDTEIAIFNEKHSSKQILVIGIEFWKNTERNIELSELINWKKVLEKTYNINYFSSENLLKEKTYPCFCFIKMQEYNKLILNYLSSSLDENKDIVSKENIISPKKKINEFIVDSIDICVETIEFNSLKKTRKIT